MYRSEVPGDFPPLVSVVFSSFPATINHKLHMFVVEATSHSIWENSSNKINCTTLLKQRQMIIVQMGNCLLCLTA